VPVFNETDADRALQSAERSSAWTKRHLHRQRFVATQRDAGDGSIQFHLPAHATFLYRITAR